MHPYPLPLCSTRLKRKLRARMPALAVLLAASAISGPAIAQSSRAEATARRLAASAIEHDYLMMKFDAAAQKLRQALIACGTRCSSQLRARIYRDLGVVLTTGLGRSDLARGSFVKALELDPTITLGEKFAASKAGPVFESARRTLNPGAPANDSKAAGPPSEPAATEAVAPEPAASAPAATEPDAAKGPSEAPATEPTPVSGATTADSAAGPKETKRRPGWLGLHIQQDFLFVSGTDVCGESSRNERDVTCIEQQTGFRYEGYPTPGEGSYFDRELVRATTRLLIGFDKLVTRDVSVGAHIGFALGGGPPARDNTRFLPAHLEARVSYWPIRPDRGGWLLPFVTVIGGVAQVQAKVQVRVVENYAAHPPETRNLYPPAQTLDAWIGGGRGFVGFAAGMLFAVYGGGGPIVKAKLMTLFPSPGVVVAPEIGYAVQF
jgi:hypothetical protein